MRYVIIAILIYVFYIVIRTVIRSLLNNRSGVSGKNTEKKTEKPKRTYNLNEVQDAEFKEVKKDTSI